VRRGQRQVIRQGCAIEAEHSAAKGSEIRVPVEPPGSNAARQRMPMAPGAPPRLERIAQNRRERSVEAEVSPSSGETKELARGIRRRVEGPITVEKPFAQP